MFLGYYCLEGLDPIGCPAGTFNSKTGLAMKSQCTDCSPGLYCEGDGNIVPTGNKQLILLSFAHAYMFYKNFNIVQSGDSLGIERDSY